MNKINWEKWERQANTDYSKYGELKQGFCNTPDCGALGGTYGGYCIDCLDEKEHPNY